MRRTIYCRSSNISPMTLIGLGLLAIVAFFLALPLFLAALMVFAAVSGYMAWRIRKIMHRMEKDLGMYGDADRHIDASSQIIDVTPDHSERQKNGQKPN